ncbi:diaminopimelate decarboxylase [Nisaea acidiphila]|uniref:Diaminopimelate decarboxylase n=1 Tax=Nisaea acidiphila TaxID=1862145 RepID=A0A9J7AL08_9PROT|nr:diaminopimelate decarboxylase [Nisaea acidiphila]UUX48176.1 diaminopimelate decarboxylase [Nisaea acidiphila]
MSEQVSYRDGALHVEQVPFARIAKEVGTPAFVYSSAGMTARYRALETALEGLPVSIYYAIKANSNLAVIKLFGDLGAGVDVVSGGELARGLRAGVPADKIVFAGVGKTEEEIAFALESGIHQFNVESEPELRLLNRVAASKGVVAPAAIRVNPDVDAKTHAKITTGRKENKFGIDIARATEMFELAATLDNVSLTSMSVHIGSQLMDVTPYRDAYARLRGATLALRQAGHVVDHLDLGGGIGVSYDGSAPPDIADYADIVKETVGDLDCRLSIEPGRYLVGNEGYFLTKVLFVKHGAERRFVIVDGAMNDLIRPTLYEAHHDIVTVAEAAAGEAGSLADIVGPICESGDYLARGRIFGDVGEGALIVLKSAGAYGAVMSSNYNSRPLAPEVMVEGDSFRTVRRRQTFDEMLALEEGLA